MELRPDLNAIKDEKTNKSFLLFRSFYFLKEELVEFCRENGLDTKGSKEELNNRISLFLEKGIKSKAKPKKATHLKVTEINENSIIETPFVCSELHRAFFKEKLGKSFKFNVAFQKYLKTHGGKTYKDAIMAYKEILSNKTETKIAGQFEYNTYIRDFFKDNKGKTLSDAILCWKYKKSIKGNNKYEKNDLKALEKE